MATDPIQSMIESIYADSKVSPSEVMRLNKVVQAAEQAAIASVADPGEVAELFKSFDDTVQHLQRSVLLIRKNANKQFTPEVTAKIYAAIEANLGLLKVNLDAFK